MSHPSNRFEDPKSFNFEEEAMKIMKVIKELDNNHIQQIKGTSNEGEPAFIPNFAQPRCFTQFVSGQERVIREQPIKVYSVVRKRVNGNVQSEIGLADNSQNIQSMSNKRITDFFSDNRRESRLVDSLQKLNKKSSNDSEVQEQILHKHSVIKSLREAVNKKKKVVSELEAEVSRIKKKSEKILSEHSAKMEEQKKLLRELLIRSYSEKIFYRMIKSLEEDAKKSTVLSNRVISITKQIEALQKEKNKNKGKAGTDQSNNFLDQYTEKKLSYFKEWRKKLGSENNAYLDLLRKQEASDNFFEIPTAIFSENERKNANGKYLPLFCTNCENFGKQKNSFLPIEIRAFNFEKLVYENLTIIPYPKTIKSESRLKIKHHLEEKDRANQQIYNSNPYSGSLFTSSTAIWDTENGENLVLGRNLWRSSVKNFSELLSRYGQLSETLSKYILKLLIRACELLKVDPIIFPQNIIFNERNDPRIDNWVANQVLKFHEFKKQEYLSIRNRHLYLPPGFHSYPQGAGGGVWTIGVLLYEALYGKKPFNFAWNLSDEKEFLLISEVEWPSKPIVTQSCKQFLKSCLCQPQQRLKMSQALKHPFFDNKK